MSREAAPLRSTNADWVRALQRTAEIAPGGTRTIAALVDENAARDPDGPALVGEASLLTHADLAALSNRVARWALAEGLAPGDRVALMMENRPDYAAIWIGLGRVGIVTALINTQLVGHGLAHCLSTAAPARVIADAACLPALTGLDAPPSALWGFGADAACVPRFETMLAELDETPLEADAAARVKLADPALLIFTSGTTGLPKAAHVSHFRIMMWSEWFAGIMDATPSDRLYNCLPMYHSIGGVVAVGAMLAAGGSAVLRRGFSASHFWADVADSGATIFQYIGELCRYLVATPPGETERRHRLRLCCGNGLRADVWTAFAERFAIPRIIEFYAATEGSFSLFNLEGKPGAIGRIPRFMAHRSPVALVRFDVAAERAVRDSDGRCLRCATGETGEAIGLIAAGSTGLATRFEGYTNPNESERKVLRDVFTPGDAWFRTGDLMRQDAAGFFEFIDRIGDTFRWKGENVATSEVVDALCACPGIVAASVYGVAVPGAEGRAGMAALVVDDGFDLARLHDQIAARLPRYARPVYLRIRAELDLTGTFKQKKSDLVREGYDRDLVSDALYVASPDGYQPIDVDAAV